MKGRIVQQNRVQARKLSASVCVAAPQRALLGQMETDPWASILVTGLWKLTLALLVVFMIWSESFYLILRQAMTVPIGHVTRPLTAGDELIVKDVSDGSP